MTGSHVAQAGFELTTELKLALPWDYKFAPPSLALSIYLILSAPTKRSCRSVHFVTAEISLSKCPYQQANKALEQQQICHSCQARFIKQSVKGPASVKTAVATDLTYAGAWINFIL